MGGPRQPPRTSPAVTAVRYGIGAVMVGAVIFLLVLNPGGFGIDGFALAVGGGLSVLMINFLFRLGVSGDLERDEEERARQYFDEHGEWPEEEEQQKGRTWTPPRGVATPEDEETP